MCLWRIQCGQDSVKRWTEGQMDWQTDKVKPVQYIPRNMHTVFALLCFVVVIHWLIFPYPSGLLHWHWGNLTIAPVPAKQPWWIWINTSCEFIMNDCITTTKQSTTKLCAYFLGYTVYPPLLSMINTKITIIWVHKHFIMRMRGLIYMEQNERESIGCRTHNATLSNALDLGFSR